MIQLTATLSVLKSLHEAHKKQTAINRVALGKAFKQAGDKTVGVLRGQAKRSFKRLPPYMAKAIRANYKADPEHSIRLHLHYPASKLLYPNSVKGFVRKRRQASQSVYAVLRNEYRAKYNLASTVDELISQAQASPRNQYWADSQAGAGSLGVIKYGGDSYLIMHRANSGAGRAVHLATAKPMFKYKRRFNFVRIASRYGAKALRRYMERAGFDV